jgi:tetratricopeptide (TPR) repeat protein
MSSTELTSQIEHTLKVMAQTVAARPAGGGNELLDELFATLQCDAEHGAYAEAEDLIWALWCTHEDALAQRSMNKVMGAMAREEFDEAQALLDMLTERWPRWAEAWNKRATLYFLIGEDAKSIADIQRTLTLEPRHFGAVSGFGQICLRVGDETSALVAFEHALRINPRLHSVREAVAILRARVVRTLH